MEGEISNFSKHALRFRQPLSPEMIFVDLLTGDAHRVHSIFKAGDFDRVVKQMPENVVLTFPAAGLSEDQLDAVRRKHKFEVYEGLRPHEEFAILD